MLLSLLFLSLRFAGEGRILGRGLFSRLATLEGGSSRESEEGERRKENKGKCWPNGALEGHMYVVTMDEISLNVFV